MPVFSGSDVRIQFKAFFRHKRQLSIAKHSTNISAKAEYMSFVILRIKKMWLQFHTA